ncbi:MAG: hypothetical protein IT209_08600 [Armatimonadetes bacterium]|nr:hypothetical protein [Armatimonadota bacterium]
MKPTSACLRLLAFALLNAFLLPAAVQGAVDQADAARIMPVSQVRAGMRGYGLTVFHGQTIERFDVKVEGVLPNINSGRPLILVRVGGGQLSRRAINIAEGMSGSPIYIGGKIIGAIAYAGSFAVEPLGLVTPIEDMLGAWDPKMPTVPPGTGQIKPLPQPIRIDGKAMTSVGILPSVDSKPTGDDPTCGWFRPMATPLIASGLSAKTLAMASDKLSMLPVSVRPGPGRMPGTQIPLKEGSAVGFSLATGDVEMTAIGTVTYVRGGRVLAFGHPFLGMGPIQLPMSTVWVHDVFPSYEASYKMASPVSIVGTSAQDMPFSVAGVIGKAAEMVPVEVNVRGDTAGPGRRFHVNILKHPLLTPVLARLVTSEALSRERPYPGEAMARVSVAVTGKDIGTVKRSNLFFSPVDITQSALGDLQDIISLLQDNRFHPVAITKLSLDVDIIQTRQTADIERMTIDRSVYQPGETIDVAVQIRPYSKDPVVRHVAVKVPDNAMDGRAILIVQGGSAASGMPALPLVVGSQAVAKPASPGEIREAASIKQMLQRYSELNTNDQLVTRLQLPTASFSIEGEKLVNFPPAMENAIQTPRATSSTLIRDEVKVASTTDWYVNGTQGLPLVIRRKSHSEKATSAAPPASASPTETTPESTDQDASKTVVAILDDGSEDVSVSQAHREPWLQQFNAASSDTDSSSDAEANVSDDTTQDTSSEDTASTVSGDDTSKSAASPETSADAAKPDGSTSKKPEQNGKPKVADIGRTTKTWLQTSEADFLKGDPTGASVSSAGAVVPGYNLSRIGSVEDPYIWALCQYGDDAFLAATGSKGRVWKINKDLSQPLFSVSGSQATSLTLTSDSRIWAGSSPDGAVWSFEKGEARKVATLPTKHIAALALAGSDSVYAAAGDSGKIWLVTANGTVSLYADTHQRNTQTLKAADGVLYAGTSGDAAVWKIADGRAEALLRVNEDYVSSVGVTSGGVVYASTGPRGKVYRIEQGKSALAVVDKLKGSSAPLVVNADQSVTVVDDESVYRLFPDNTKTTQKADDLQDVFALSATSAGDIIGGTTNGSVLWRLSPATSASFESAVHDAGRLARWGFVQDVTRGGKTQLEVRCGNTPEPDQTWSAWKAVDNSSSAGISSQRYLQYRAKLSDGSARLEQVQISYLPVNQPPTVKLTKPVAGAVISGSQTVSWSGSDPDGDKLSYKLFYSADKGKTWKVLDGAVARASSTAQTTETKSEPPSSTQKPAAQKVTLPDRAELEAMLKDHPEIPAELREQILASAPEVREKFSTELEAEKQEKAASAAGTAASQEKSEKSTTNTSYTWDTTKFDDGLYLLKIEASDALANGPDALTHTAQIGPIRVANAKPEIRLFGWAEPEDGGELMVRGHASSKSATIVTVQYRVDEKGDWAVAVPADGMFDGFIEDFRVPLKGIKDGQHTVEAQIKDSAGNTARVERTIKIRAKAAQKPKTEP